MSQGQPLALASGRRTSPTRPIAEADMEIYLIESDQGMREALTSILEDADYTVRHVWPPEDALDPLRAAPTVHTVIISNQSPDNHRIVAFFEQIAADPALGARHRYVALTTTVASFNAEAQALLARLHAPIIEKPFNVETLLAALQNG